MKASQINEGTGYSRMQDMRVKKLFQLKYIKSRVRHTLRHNQIDLRPPLHTHKWVLDAINQEPHEWLLLPPTTATFNSFKDMSVGGRGSRCGSH